MIQFDRSAGVFVPPDGAASEEAIYACAKLNETLPSIRGWLNLKRSKGKYAYGLLVEIAYHSVGRGHHIHAIYDEIGKLEGTDTRPSCTKRPKQMRAPLRGLWHKHYYYAGFFVKNLVDETERMGKDGRWVKMFAPHYGKYVHEFAGQIAYEAVDGAYRRRMQDNRMTGEFIVYEPQQDGSNYYLTLGLHGEYYAIRTRVDTYKQFDAGSPW